jgi:hypothetical protein
MKINFNAKRNFGLLAIISGLSLLMGYQNCSKVGVSDLASSVASQSTPPSGCAAGESNCGDAPPGGTVMPPPNTCTTTLTQVSNVKVFFLIDVSGSNQTGQKPVSATDPSDLDNGHCHDKTAVTASTYPQNCKPWRLGVLDKFLGIGDASYAANGYLGKSGFQFQLGVFQGSSASALIVNSMTKKTMFSGDSATVIAAANSFLTVKDTNSTPYQAVLNMAASAIEQDIADNGNMPSKYVIVMMTDGMPTDKDFSTNNAADNIANLKAAVSQLANVAPGYITFNTVQYYPADGSADPNAKSYLQAMAQAGSGLYSESSSKSIPFEIDNQVTVPTGSTNCPDGQNN